MFFSYYKVKPAKGNKKIKTCFKQKSPGFPGLLAQSFLRDVSQAIRKIAGITTTMPAKIKM